MPNDCSPSKGADDAARINDAYQRALGRDVRENERKSLTGFLATQREYFAAHQDDAKKLIHTGFSPVARK